MVNNPTGFRNSPRATGRVYDTFAEAEQNARRQFAKVHGYSAGVWTSDGTHLAEIREDNRGVYTELTLAGCQYA